MPTLVQQQRKVVPSSKTLTGQLAQQRRGGGLGQVSAFERRRLIQQKQSKPSYIYSQKGYKKTITSSNIIYTAPSKQYNSKQTRDGSQISKETGTYIPEEVILEEAKILSKRFNLNYDEWEDLLRCEATCTKLDHEEIGCELGKISNLVRNRTSTAVGLGEYLIGTWYETESWKKFRKARTDHKATLWEMGLDLSTGQQDKWVECNNILGIYDYK